MASGCGHSKFFADTHTQPFTVPPPPQSKSHSYTYASMPAYGLVLDKSTLGKGDVNKVVGGDGVGLGGGGGDLI